MMGTGMKAMPQVTAVEDADGQDDVAGPISKERFFRVCQPSFTRSWPL